MSQQPDTPSPSSYWQIEQPELGGELESDQAAQPGQSYASATSVVPQDQQSGSLRAWQVPPVAALPPASAPSAPSSPLRTMPKVRRPSLSRILVPLVIVVLLGLVGSASGLGFSVLSRQHGQATAPSPTATTGQTLVGSPTAPPRMSPTPTRPAATPTPTTMPTPTPVPQPVILAQDSFARPDQPFWGMASNGSTWGGDANSSQVFSVVGGEGLLRGGQGFFNAILGPQVANEEVFYSGTLSHFDATRDNLGAVLRWTDNEHYYKAYVDGANLILIKRSAGVVTRLGAVPFAARDGVSYSLRFRAAGGQLLVRAWPSAGTEPGGWMIMATDSTLASGFGGLRALLEPGITVAVTAFRELAVVGQGQ